MSLAVQTRELSKSYGHHRALDAIDLQIPAGSICAVVGPNGAGKTTLFACLARFLRADSGSVELFGETVHSDEDVIGRLSTLPQDASFNRNLPVFDQLIEFRRLDGCPRRQAEADVMAMIERVGLGEALKRGLHGLSHGMAKRLSLAQAFLGDPRLVLLDEPLAGVDPANSTRIIELIHDLRDRQATVCISSHDMRQLQEHCDHLIVLKQGRVVTNAPMHAVLQARAQMRLRFRSAPANAIDALRESPMVSAMREERDGNFTVELTDESDASRKALLQRCLDLDLLPIAVRDGGLLEEAYLEMTED